MHTPVYAVTVEATLAEVAMLLSARGFTTVPVLTDQCRLLGIVTDADVGRAWLVAHRDQPEDGAVIERAAHTVGAMVHRPPVVVTADAELADVVTALLTTHTQALPVQNGDRVVGMIGWKDLLPYLAPALPSDIQSAG